MSRVDDAVRRANAAGQLVVDAPLALPSGETLDAAVLAEQFFAAQPLDANELAQQFLGPPAGPDPGPAAALPPNALVPGAQQPFLGVTPAAERAAAPVPAERTGAQIEPVRAESLFSRMSGDVAQKVVIDQGLQVSAREQYRRLAATLHHGQLAHGLKVITLTSALPSEGKTLTSSNLAMTLSESYRRKVLLIDADLRRPALHAVFNIENTTGLCDGLSAVTERPLPLRQISEHLSILTAGRPSSDPMAGLISDRFRRLIEEARGVFDWVIIDTPPVALLTDSRLLASRADGTILVVRAESTEYALVKKAAESIGRDRILGVVLNSALISARGVGGGSYYYGDYDYYGTPRHVTKKSRLMRWMPARFRRKASASPAPEAAAQ